jgi:hypothetical protein
MQPAQALGGAGSVATNVSSSYQSSMWGQDVVHTDVQQ